MSADVWTIVLAAGSGRRLAAVTGGVPKQFWRPHDGASPLVGETIARLQTLAPLEQTVTVVDDSHREHVRAMADRWPLGEVLYQPLDRGTAAGVLLPLMAVLASAPDATVIVTPSDHGVGDTFAFRAGLKQAIARVQARTCDLVLFGVEPTGARADYGWITPSTTGRLGHGTFQRVVRFVEKPPVHEAFQLFLSGAVWNTMVVVARAAGLLERFRAHLPFMADVLARATDLEPGKRDAFLRDWYPELPRADFSRDLLARSVPMCLYTWPAQIGWSDLGTPERLEEWLAVGRTDGDSDHPPDRKRAA